MLQGSNSSSNIYSFPGLTIDLTKFTVVANEQLIDLSPKEFQLLSLLAQNPNTVFSSEELFQLLWGSESYGDHRTVMVHISNIRKKVEQNPSNPTFIQTVKGVGYKFCIE
jgi:DNA-binding response OmpR family regulator